MNEAEIVRFLTGWDEAAGFRLAAALVGTAIIFFLARRIWRRKGGWLPSLLGSVVALMLLAFAAQPQALVDFVISIPYETRIRVNMGAVSVLVLLVTFEAIRKTRLQERYALLWIATAIVIFASALFPQTVALFRALTGMEYTTALVAMAFAFLILVSFHFSVSISTSRSNQARLAQKVAILEERLRRLDKEGNSPAPEPDGDADPQKPSANSPMVHPSDDSLSR